MKLSTRLQLSTMMFLEFFVWGAWFVTLGTFLVNNLSANGAQTASVFSTQSWGAIIAPFIIGLIADRYFNAEKIMGVLHLVGAFLLYQVYNYGETTAVYPPEVFYYLLMCMILYMPTLALVNSISFNHMKDPEKEFSSIRVWGTISWIAAGLLISAFVWDSKLHIQQGMMRNTFLMGAIASAVLGIFSFTLPKTPPKVNKEDRKSTRLNSSHMSISYAVFCLKKKKKKHNTNHTHIHQHQISPLHTLGPPSPPNQPSLIHALPLLPTLGFLFNLYPHCVLTVII